MKYYMKSCLLAVILAGGMGANLSAQEQIFQVKGKIADKNLRLDNKVIKKVYLNRMDAAERFIVVDSSEVAADGTFTLSYKMPEKAMPEIGHITGFDNGITTLWMEPGVAEVFIEKALYPQAAQIGGTPTNKLAEEYKQFRKQCISTQTDFLEKAGKEHGTAWLDGEEGIQQRTEIGSKAVVQAFCDEMQFVLDHASSPIAPLTLQKELMFQLDEYASNTMMNAISPTLKEHPYYAAARNAILAKYLKVGAEAPDITLPTVDNKQMHLSDLRGRYVLLDFWASWCGPCRKEIPFLIQLFNETQGKRDQLALVSFSIDNKEDAWKKAITDRGMNLEGWIHASDLKGWQSPEAQMFGVEAVPRTVLINPEGKVVAFDLRGEEMVRKVKQLIGM